MGKRWRLRKGECHMQVPASELAVRADERSLWLGNADSAHLVTRSLLYRLGALQTVRYRDGSCQAGADGPSQCRCPRYRNGPICLWDGCGGWRV
jgi:hypothetical protein